MLWWRELRGGFSELGLPIAGLALGIALITALHMMKVSVLEGLENQGRALLGGDLEFRLAYRPVGEEEGKFLLQQGKLSEIQEMRAMIQGASETPLLSELKAIDSHYPLFGSLELDPPLVDPFVRKNNIPGAVAEPLLVDRLHLKLGDRITIGTQEFELRARILEEPDRATRIFSLGPRLMIDKKELAATGLVQPGSLIYHTYRLALSPGENPTQVKAQALKRFPQAGWRIRDIEDAGEGTKRFLGNLASFLNLIGWGALMLGGLGIFAGVTRYLEKRAAPIAILLCLGAPGKTVFSVYLLTLLSLGFVATGIGVGIAAILPWLLAPLLLQFGLPLTTFFYGEAVGLALAIGIFTTLIFGLIPLLRAVRTQPAQLLRLAQLQLGSVTFRDYRWIFVLILVGLGGLIYFSTERWVFLAFWIALFFCWLFFMGIGFSLQKFAGKMARDSRRRMWRMAWQSINRSPLPVRRVLVILGLILTLLVTLTQITGSLSRLVEASLPAQAPSFYFLDIPPQEAKAFDQMAANFPTAHDLQRVPMMRGKIVKIKGIDVDQITPPPELAWVLRSDRGLTWAAEQPSSTRLILGQWWPKDYRGPLLISLDEEVAKGFGLQIGDSLTVNLLGREIEGKIANLRAIDWAQLGINFVMIFSPGTLEHAPQTHIATLRVDENREAELMNKVTKAFPGISSVRVKDAIDAVAGILRTITLAVHVMGALALGGGILVLSGAILLGQSERIYEAVILKTIGAQRKDLLMLHGLEFSLIGCACAFSSLLLGTAASYMFIHFALHNDWFFSPSYALAAIAISLVLSLAAGFLGRWRALGQASAPFLRNE